MKAIDFVNLLEDLSFMQHINEPPHSCSHTLDLIITRELSVGISLVRDVVLSDHYLIVFAVNRPESLSTFPSSDLVDQSY